ncbi:hypothetical protein GBAR_LOCUS27755, partial [Geodia barretti]
DTLRVVFFINIFKIGFIFVAVFTGVRSLGTRPLLVGSDAVTLEPIPTPMLTLYRYKLTPSQLVILRWIAIQVLFVFSKFPPPFTAVVLVTCLSSVVRHDVRGSFRGTELSDSVTYSTGKLRDSTIAQPDAEPWRPLIQSTTAVRGVAPEVPRPLLPLLGSDILAP